MTTHRERSIFDLCNRLNGQKSRVAPIVRSQQLSLSLPKLGAFRGHTRWIAALEPPRVLKGLVQNGVPFIRPLSGRQTQGVGAIPLAVARPRLLGPEVPTARLTFIAALTRGRPKIGPALTTR